MVTRTRPTPLMKFALILTSIAFGSVACTGKSSQRTVHAKAIQSDDGPPIDVEKTRDEIQKVYNNSGNADQLISNKSSTSKVVLAAVQDLAKTVLNTEIIENTTLSGKPEFRSLLATMNRGIVRLINEDPKLLKDSGLLLKYQQVAFAGCDDTLELKNCIQLGIFRESNGSLILTAIALELKEQILKGRLERNADYLKNVVAFYKTLSAAFELTNAVANDQLNLAYVQMSQDYFAYLNSLPIDKNSANLKRKHNAILNIALTRIRDRLEKSPKNKLFCEYIISTNPLHFQISSEGAFDRRSMRFMVQEYIDCTSKETGPRSLETVVASLLNEENDRLAKKYEEDKTIKLDPKELIKSNDNGFGYTRSAVLDSPKMTKSLGIDGSLDANGIARFVIDRLFYQKIDQTMARLYWNKIKDTKDKKILNFIRQYARIQMAYELKTTWQNFGRILTQEFEKRNGLGTGFYDDVIQRTNNQSQQTWDLLGNRMRALSDFIKQAYDSEKKNAAFYPEIRKLLSDLEAINDRVDFTEMKDFVQPSHYDHMGVAVVSPLTMALYYYMAKSQGTIKIYVPWWPSNDQTFSINGQSALHDYLSYNGDIQYQFFKLGSSQYKLDHLSKLHALNFALRSGLFEYVPFDLLADDKKIRPFAATEVEANNQFLFFRQAFQDVFRYWESSFNGAVRNIDTIGRDSNFKERFLNMCQDPLRAQINFERIDNLKSGTIFEEASLFKSVQSIYDTGRFMSGWRSDRDKIKAYIDVIEAHYAKNMQLSNAPVVAKIKTEMNRFEALEKGFYRKLFELDQQIVSKNDDCLLRLHKAEKLRTDVILKENIEYYRNVHAAMTLLQITDSIEANEALSSIYSLINNWQQSKVKSATTKDARAQINDVKLRMSYLASTLSIHGLKALGADNIEQALRRVLGIHNFNVAPFVGDKSELGFFVTGVDLWNKTGDAVLKSSNIISKDLFAQSPWDTLVRLRRQLQVIHIDHRIANSALGTKYTSSIPLAAALDIPLGTLADLEQAGSLYTNNFTLKIDYQEDQTKFVRQAMIQLAGNQGGSYQNLVSWRSDGRQAPTLFDKRFSWMRELAKLGAIEVGENDDKLCPKNEFGIVQATRNIYGQPIGQASKFAKCEAIKVTPQNILETFIQLGDALKLTEDDRTLLDWLDLRALNSSLINHYFSYSDLDKETTIKWTWFDKFYRSKLVSVTMYSGDGKATYVESLRGKDDFTEYHDSFLLNIRSGRNLLPLQPEPTQIERNLIRQKIIDHMSEIKEYDREIENIENTRELGEIVFENHFTKTAQEQYKFGNWRYVAVNRRKSGPRAGTPIYLEDRERTKEWYSGFLMDFFKKEGCGAIPEGNDPDSKGLIENREMIVDASKDCEVRYINWKKNLDTFK